MKKYFTTKIIYPLMRALFVQAIIASAFSLFALARETNAQELLDRRITLQVQSQQVKNVLSNIEKQVDIKFMYAHELIRANRRISIDAANERLEDVLKKLLEPLRINYEISGRRILLSSLPAQSGAVPETESASFAFTVSGRVTDDGGQPMTGVNVLEKGSANGAVTDAEGKFRLQVTDEKSVLVISYIGYASEEIPVNGRSEIQVRLLPDLQSLSEVVVVGYGTQKQREVTGAVGSVSAKDIAAVTVTGLDQALQGRIAGVQVTQNNGEPGGNVSVRIRGLASINGSNEPLYIVDGVPYGNLNAINPNDIERIDVLKDAASAAIYGSRGSNGVVLVTTKRGAAGKVQVTLDAYAGTQSPLRTIPLLNGPQFAQLANEYLVNGGQDPNPAWSNPSAVPNTDWQDQLMNPAPIQSYNVNISGGGERSRSLVSVGYFDQGGILAQSHYKRYTARINTDYDITKRFKVGITLNGAFDDKRGTRTDEGNASSTQGGLMTAAISHPANPLTADYEGLFSLNPDGSIDPTGNIYYGYEGTVFVSNLANGNYYPAGLSNPTYAYEELRDESRRTQELLAAAFGELELIKGLKVRSAINLTSGNNETEWFWKGLPVQEVSGRGLYGLNARYQYDPSKSRQWNWINTVSYGKTFGKHNFTALAGIDALKSSSRGIGILTSNNPNNQPFVSGAPANSAGNPTSRIVTGGAWSPYSLLSYLGRVTYDYAGKYLLTANIRRDGSSNFNPDGDYQFGVFPSVSAGWLISEEAFMRRVNLINTLKLRASYGQVGNQGIPAFGYVSQYSSNSNRRSYPLGLNQEPVVGFFPSVVGTPDIRWETSTMSNIGIDAAFLNNSITLTAEYYVKDIDDMLGFFPVARYTGLPTPSGQSGPAILRNGFSMQNSGFELDLGYNRQFGDFGFSVSANYASLNNKVTKLTGSETGFVSSNISAGDDGGADTRTVVGQPVGNFRGYVADGIFQSQDEVEASAMKGMTRIGPGDRRYKDLNGDGVLNELDKTFLGNGLPKHTFGFNMNMNFKGFDLAVLLNGQAGVQIANQTKYWLNHMRYNNGGGISNGSTDLLESWTPENGSNTFTRNSFSAAPSNRWFSDFNIENGAFLRVRNVQLGYTIPEAISQKMRIGRARVYVSAQNLFTFTQYSGYDPEVGSRVSFGRGNALQTGVDFGRYPVSRMFTGGVNFQF